MTFKQWIKHESLRRGVSGQLVNEFVKEMITFRGYTEKDKPLIKELLNKRIQAGLYKVNKKQK